MKTPIVNASRRSERGSPKGSSASRLHSAHVTGNKEPERERTDLFLSNMSGNKIKIKEVRMIQEQEFVDLLDSPFGRARSFLRSPTTTWARTRRQSNSGSRAQDPIHNDSAPPSLRQSSSSLCKDGSLPAVIDTTRTSSSSLGAGKCGSRSRKRLVRRRGPRPTLRATPGTHAAQDVFNLACDQARDDIGPSLSDSAREVMFLPSRKAEEKGPYHEIRR